MRPLRLQAADTTYHVSTRGNRRGEIVRDDLDRRRFISILRIVVRRRGWICHFYCLLTNHYHLLVTTPEPDIAVGMHALNNLTARTFNKRHGHTGHLFERRYSSAVVKEEGHLLECYRYIALNPVRAGLCSDPADWPWSSYPATIGRAPVPDFLNVDGVLAQFSADRKRAQQLLHEFVLERLTEQRAA